MQYRTANDRLPCPADITITPKLSSTNYGVEAANPGVCTGGTPAANNSAGGVTNTFAVGVEGALPAVSLGLPLDFMVDGWGNKFRYAVDMSMTANAAFVNATAGCIDGAITINDSNGNARSTSAIYALISHGPNGHGAYTRNGALVNAGSTNVNEQTNCHCDATATATTYTATYVQMAPYVDSAAATDTFDDLVTYKERWQMRTDWDLAGRCIYVYVADRGGNRIEIFNTSRAYISQIGCASGACTGGSGNGQLSSPNFVATDTSGNLWVGDNGNHRVEKFNSSANYASTFGTTAQSNWSQAGVTVDASGNVWVVGQGGNFVDKYNSAGTYLSQVAGCSSGACTASSANGQFNLPMGLTFESTGNLWVADSGNARVEGFNNSGSYLSQFGSGHLNDPYGGLAIDASGNFWVVDAGTDTMQKYNSSGTYLTQFGTFGSSSGTFSQPNGIAIDSSGNLWVADSANNRVQEFNSSGTFLGQIGCASGGCPSSTANGGFNFPYGIAISGR